MRAACLDGVRDGGVVAVGDLAGGEGDELLPGREEAELRGEDDRLDVLWAIILRVIPHGGPAGVLKLRCVELLHPDPLSTCACQWESDG